MIWQEIAENGQQRPIAISTALACIEEAVTTTALITLAFATTVVRPLLTATILSAQFYIYREKPCEKIFRPFIIRDVK